MRNQFHSRKQNKFTRKHFIILIVCIVTGFIIGYSYNVAKDDKNIDSVYLNQEDFYRTELIEQQERNKELNEEINELQHKIRGFERSFSEGEDDFIQLVEEAERLRLLLGELPTEGQGIKVTLKDGEYNPRTTNPNEYIVHESHIFMVINELKISGAEAISINGQRITPSSFIYCNGPVITIDGKQYPAPFEIEAIGNAKNLVASLKITGGVFDKLLNDQIVVTIQEMDHIKMPSINDKG
jgi:uncharacterized protein YlxW (UPF0749 family)